LVLLKIERGIKIRYDFILVFTQLNKRDSKERERDRERLRQTGDPINSNRT